LCSGAGTCVAEGVGLAATEIHVARAARVAREAREHGGGVVPEGWLCRVLIDIASQVVIYSVEGGEGNYKRAVDFPG
jgi:hypothetical protein